MADRNGGRTLDFLMGLTSALYEQSTHIVRDEGAPLAPLDTLRSRTGSCRDLAVLFCAASRCHGIPARFVSGYDCGAGHVDHAYMHAWAEVYLEGGGWRGYDPSRGLAAPSTGTFRGAAKSEMQFHIDVQLA
jgi:transglutaminase-like putative cysteine protease